MNKSTKTARNSAKATSKNCSAKTTSTVKNDCSKKGCKTNKTRDCK